MKYLLLIMLIGMYSVAFSQNDEYVKAYFENDTLAVIDSNLTANCAAKFRLDTIMTQSDSIRVFFADTSILKADCICKFTLKAMISKAPSGNFVVAVYHNEYRKYEYPADTSIFIGSVKIIIPQSMKAASSRFEQSDCYSHNPEGVSESDNKSEKVFPNPAEGSTELEFSIVQPGSAVLCINDVYGRYINSRSIPELQAGDNKIEVNIRDLSSGIYYCTLTTNKGERKMFKIVVNR